jgi:nucleoside-diphosphate-sugar epimerase
MPGHIVGPGWVPLNPVGNFNSGIYEELSSGKPFTMPNLGLETLHHVHADDVGQVFMKALSSRNTAIGEDFHAVSEQALTLRGYAEAVIRWFGNTPDLQYLPLNEWCVNASEEDAQQTRWHVSHSSHCSIEKAKRLLGYSPRYSSLEAIFESLTWLIENGEIKR